MWPMSMHFTVNTKKNADNHLHSALFLFTELEPYFAVMLCQIQPRLVTVTFHDTAPALSTKPGPLVPFSLDPCTTNATQM